MNDDERNVDEQLDEAQKRADARSARPMFQNNRNNTRTDADERSAIAGAFGATVGTTVTNPSNATSGQTVTNDDSEGASA